MRDDWRGLHYFIDFRVSRRYTGIQDRNNPTDRLMQSTPPFDPTLLELIRCPVAVQYKDRGDDPGRLTLVRDSWLVCEDSGCKYPIRNGIPVLLVEEGEKWKHTAVDDLPVPPPA